MNEASRASKARKSLRRCFEARIFRRGESYFEGGRVRGFSATEPDARGIVTLRAKVKGSRTYDVTVLFDGHSGAFEAFECTCPYADEDNCKHAAALGLAYIERLSADPPPAAASDAPLAAPVAVAYAAEPDGADVLNMIDAAVAGRDISPEAIDALIARLGLIKQDRIRASQAPPVVPRERPSPKERRFEANPTADYYIVLEAYRNCALELHRKDRDHGQVSAKPLLANTRLTDAQRMVLERVCEDARRFQFGESDTKDFGSLFLALHESGFEVYHGWRTHGSRLTINADPAPLPARLSREIRYNEYRDFTHHTFHFSLPRCQSGDDPGVSIFADDGHIILINGSAVDVYRSTPALSRLVQRIHPQEDVEPRGRGQRRGARTICLETELDDDDLVGINALMADAKDCLGLETDLEPFEIVKHTEAVPTLFVDYSSAEETLDVAAAVDYGCAAEDVSENIFMSNRNGVHAFRTRENWKYPGKRIMAFNGNRIAYADKRPKAEMKLFKALYDDPANGFTKTLKCHRSGRKSIFEFARTRWPYLKGVCERDGIRIAFPRDEFKFESVDFRADVSAELKADRDWLAFDLACYCGPDKVTIEDLRRFIAEGDSFLKTADGRLLHIANREELERFVLMLESFVRREGRFEGRLYHAPELEYVFTHSPNYTARFEKGFKTFLKEAQSGKPVERVALSARHAKLLRPYQRDGVSWMYFLRKFRFAGILADDMGLGKTVQTLILLAREKTPRKPSIVICPKTLLYNWQSEAARFTPELKVGVIDGPPAARAAMIARAKSYDLLVTGYAMMQKDAEAYERARVPFNYAVLDEAQFIKNHATKSAQIVKKINADYRLALTGTPLENSVTEIWSIFDFLMPGFLGSYAAFARRFEKPIMERGDAQALAELRKKAECFMLRRTKEAVLKELPPKVEQVSHCRLEPAQNLLYQEVLSRVRNDIFETVETKGFEKSRIHIFSALMKLRQICNHPALLLDDADYAKYPSAKLDMFNELIDEIAENRRKVLVFSQFTTMLDILSAELKRREIAHVALTGKTRDRQSLVNRFNADPELPVFLISLKAGGTGLNLASADNVILFDPWWNPSVEEQATGRAHRIGQTRSVNVFRFITTGTIEEKMVDLQGKKKRLFEGVVGESHELFKKLTWDDVKRLFE